MVELKKAAGFTPQGAIARLKDAARSMRRNASRNNLRDQTLSQVIEEDEHSFEDDLEQMTESYNSFSTQQRQKASCVDLTESFQNLNVDRQKEQSTVTETRTQANTSRPIRPSKNLRHAAFKPVYRQRASQSTPNLTRTPQGIDDMMHGPTFMPKPIPPALVISAHFVNTTMQDKLAPSTTIPIENVNTGQAFWDKAYASLGNLEARQSMFHHPSLLLFTITGVTGTMQCETCDENDTIEMYDDFLSRCKASAKWRQEQRDLVVRAKKTYVIGGGASDNREVIVAGEVYMFFGELA